jgi:predicted GNAT family N-acyltransferase
MKRKLIFREIYDDNELKEMYQFRYLGYIKSNISNLLDVNDLGLDISKFDLSSKHVGLYDGLKLVATMRLCIEKQLFTCFKTQSLIKNLNIKIKNETADFPFLTYPESQNKSLKFYQDMIFREVRISEVGKFVISNELRGLNVLKHLFHCMSAFASLHFSDQGIGITTTQTRHLSLYHEVGFKNLVTFKTHGLDSTTLTMKVSKNLKVSSTPKHKINHIQKLQDELVQYNQITILL